MATTYRTQSANVLNDADSFERKLDWMLFAQEQNARLWSDPRDWKPGDDLFFHPWAIYRNCGCADHESCADCEGYVGNHTQPMISQIPDGVFNTPRVNAYIRCEPCGVDWLGTEPCWVCGEERPGRSLIRTPIDPGFQTRRNELQYHFSIDVRFDTRSLVEATSRMTESMTSIVEQMRLDFNRVFVQRETLSLRGFRVPELVVETPPQETVACDEISFEFDPDSLYVETCVSGFLDMPRNLSLSPRVRTPEVPRIEFRSSHPVAAAERYWLDRPITEQRRRRDL